jgi:hypothetical protein
LVFSLCFFSNSSASVDICQQPTAYSHLSIAYYNQQKSSLDQSNGTTRQENHDFDLLFKLSDNWMFGAGHRYVILKFDPLVPEPRVEKLLACHLSLFQLAERTAIPATGAAY